MARNLLCALHVTSLCNCLILTQDSLVLLMVKQCKHCGLPGKFSSGVTEISTAQSHYQLHLIYFLWFQNAFCGSFTSFLSSQKISPL